MAAGSGATCAAWASPRRRHARSSATSAPSAPLSRQERAGSPSVPQRAEPFTLSVESRAACMLAPVFGANPRDQPLTGKWPTRRATSSPWTPASTGCAAPSAQSGRRWRNCWQRQRCVPEERPPSETRCDCLHAGKPGGSYLLRAPGRVVGNQDVLVSVRPAYCILSHGAAGAAGEPA